MCPHKRTNRAFTMSLYRGGERCQIIFFRYITPMKSQNLHQKAQHWARRLGRLPGVLCVSLSGSMATGRATSWSDIDLFFICAPGQIWTARFFVFLVLKGLGAIATEAKHAGQICPNHFITADSLRLRQQAKYTADLFSSAIPLFDPYGIWPHFQAQNKDWIASFGHEYKTEVTPKKLHLPKRKNGLWRMVERVLRFGQIHKIRRNPQFQRPGAQIVLSETELRFHPSPRVPNAGT